MQAFVKKEMKKYPELELMLLDGRTSSFLEVSERIRHLSNDVCVLVGTWRIDCTENYVMGNTTYMLRDANPTLPVFTIASVGLGHWALGGYTRFIIRWEKIAGMPHIIFWTVRPAARLALCLFPVIMCLKTDASIWIGFY